MNKSGLTTAVQRGLGCKSADAARIVEAYFATIADALVASDAVKLNRFGTLIVHAQAERQGRDPQTGAPMRLAARRRLAFRSARLLRALLNDELG